MSSHNNGTTNQNKERLKTNSFCRHRSGSLSLMYTDPIIFKEKTERHLVSMLNLEGEYASAQDLLDNRCLPIAESQLIG